MASSWQTPPTARPSPGRSRRRLRPCGASTPLADLPPLEARPSRIGGWLLLTGYFTPAARRFPAAPPAAAARPVSTAPAAKVPTPAARIVPPVRQARPEQVQIRPVAIALAVVLIPAVSIWVAGMENVYGGRPTYLSVFFHAVLLLAALQAVSTALSAISPRLRLSRAELLVIYSMVCISSGIVGDQFMAILIPSLPYPFRYATPANRWEDILWPYIPRHAVVSDPVAVRHFFEGDTMLYLPENFRPWLLPGLLWASFIAATQLMCLAVNLILRKQWTENEKLSFPLVILPVEMTSPTTGLWRSRPLWIGFAISAFIDIYNGLSVHIPAIPPLPVKNRWIRWSRRWAAALTSTGIAFYPFIIGIGYLLPGDLTFSTWFFFWFFRFQRFLFSALGYPSPYPWQSTGYSAPPAMLEQGIGAYMAVVVFSLWAARRHLSSVWQMLWEGSDPDAHTYRLAAALLIAGLAFTTAFGSSLGMPASVAFIYILLYLVINTAITKIRAEAGAPAHGFHFAGPDHVILTLRGPRSMSTREKVAFGLFFGFNRGYPSVPMPHQLEGLKIAELIGADHRRYAAAEAIATALGPFAAVWALLHLCFREGVEQMGEPARRLSPQGWQLVNYWLHSSIGPNLVGLGGIIAGFAFSTFLILVRFRFVWWPFHPIGYAIAADWTAGLIWLPLLIGWGWKTLVMRYAGPKTYRAGLPIALGLMLGEFVVGGFWSILAMATRKPQYHFWT